MMCEQIPCFVSCERKYALGGAHEVCIALGALTVRDVTKSLPDPNVL